MRDFFVSYGFDQVTFDQLLAEDRTRRFSQIGGLINLKGQRFMDVISPDAGTNEMHRGLKATLGPIDLGGMKEGFQISIEIDNNWIFHNDGTKFFTSDVDAAMEAGGWDQFPTHFHNTIRHVVKYTGPDAGAAPILTLADDVTSWEIGDKIVVGATHFDPRESETFIIVECAECSANQLKVDRTPTNTHWGRIDPRSGADQRGQVGLLTRNVRFYGEMNADNTCKVDYHYN